MRVVNLCSHFGTGRRQSSADDVSSPFNQLQPTYVDYISEDRTSSLPTISRHPKPMAVSNCLFANFTSNSQFVALGILVFTIWQPGALKGDE